MSIKEYKLSEIARITRGKKPKPLNKYVTNNSNDIPWVKISDINGFYLSDTKTFFRRNEIDKTLFVEKNSLLLTIEGSVGIPFICDIDCAIDNHICLITNYSFVLKKYLFYFLIKNKTNIQNMASGTVLLSISKKTLENIKVKLLDIKTQQQIIDIIEPKENLFIKYKDLVNIESLDEFKKTWSILIDIIESFEKLKQNMNRTLFMISNLMDSINLYVKPIGLMKDFNVIFEKGKNIPSDLITTSETKIPFINVSAINNNINKYIIDNDIFHENITYGDVVLSLDGTIGLVNNFVSGINGYGYKVYSNTIHESIIYYSLLNKINFDIISKCSKGSVIKHASSSKDKLLIFDYKEINIKAIYGLEIMVKNKLLLIDKIIKYSIEKYVL